MKRIVKRVIALTMVAIMAFLVPAAPLSKSVKAAGSNNRYIKELRLYITESKSAREKADEWCEKQSDKDGGNWEVISDDVNKGSAGAMKSTDYVYICANITDDPNEAVTDIAVMNEYGNYDESAYEIILKEQREAYADYVADLKTMISEYRANYEKKLPTAVQAHDMLNRFKEDDSGKLMGDLLLTISDADLAEVLLQAQGQIVLYIEQQLGLACDKGKNTFLDRMEAFGSYDGLRKKFLKAYNNNAQKADAALKANFHDRALQALEYWDDINVHIDNLKEFYAENGFDRMSKEQANKWLEEHNTDLNTVVSDQQLATVQVLASYKYDDKTLLDFFATPREEIEKDIKQLYPLVASLTDGQFAGANQGVGLYNLVQDAAIQTMLNDYSTGKSAEIEEAINDADKRDDEAVEGIKEFKDALDENVDAWSSQEAVSVYEGVDRDIYKGGVAVTSTAIDFGKKSGGNWTDSFVDGSSKTFEKTAVALAVSSVISGLGACMFKYAMIHTTNQVGREFIGKIVKSYDYTGMAETAYTIKGLRPSTLDLVTHIYDNKTGKEGWMKTWKYIQKGAFKDVDAVQLWGPENRKICRLAIDDMVERGYGENHAAATRYKVFRNLKIGLSVFAVVLAAVDIVMTVTTLVEYYNRDHLPIPHHMVDLTYNEDEETSFIAYKSVKDDEGEYGDLNGGSGKQWLAIYATYDKDAGDPILADSFVTQYGSDKIESEYSSLHFFGKPNAPQNLTYADGSNGWSYNDKENGVYCFFKRDAYARANSYHTGTSLSYGIVGVSGGIGLIIGLIAGFGLNTMSRRRKKTGGEKWKKH